LIAIRERRWLLLGSHSGRHLPQIGCRSRISLTAAWSSFGALFAAAWQQFGVVSGNCLSATRQYTLLLSGHHSGMSLVTDLL
jgi:hypothetical protein